MHKSRMRRLQASRAVWFVLFTGPLSLLLLFLINRQPPPKVVRRHIIIMIVVQMCERAFENACTFSRWDLLRRREIHLPAAVAPCTVAPSRREWHTFLLYFPNLTKPSLENVFNKICMRSTLQLRWLICGIWTIPPSTCPAGRASGRFAEYWAMSRFGRFYT